LHRFVRSRYREAMSERSKSGADQRAERLAQALRENLRRRKAQSRDKETGSGEPPEPPESDPPGDQ